MEEFDFDGKLDFDGMEEFDFDGKLDFDGKENQEGDGFEPIADSDDSQKPDSDGNTDDINEQPNSFEQEKESHENLNSESTTTVLISENAEEAGEYLQNEDQNHEEIEEINQDEFNKEIEKELEEGVKAINHYLEEEADFINAYQEMVGEARELDAEREGEGEESLKTEEEWEKEVQTAAYTAEQLYENTNEIEADDQIEELSEINEELDIEKEAEQREEVLEPQSSELQEDFEGQERDEIEQHQVEPLIEDALETEPESIINDKEIEELQEMDLEEQFQKVHDKENLEELVEWQSEKAVQEKEREVEAQLDNSKEIVSELEELREDRDEVEQHQVEPFIEDALETESEPIINDKEIEELQEMDLEEQFQMVHDKENIEELVEWQSEKVEQEKEKEVETQEVLHQSTYLQEKLEEQEQELEREYEEKDEVEQHQVEAVIEEELETEPKPIINEEELEYIKNFDPKKQLDAELLYELIEELIKKQNEEQGEQEELRELEENEEQKEISKEMKVDQIMRELEIAQELKSSATEVETTSQEEGLKQETSFSDTEVVEQLEIEKNTDHQQELEEILEQNRKIEQEEESNQTAEEKYERVKRLYKQQTGKRPIYAVQETKGFKQWLEQRKEAEKQEKMKQELDLKEEQKNEEAWKRTLKNRIEEAREIEPELKSKLIKLVEKYNELEKLIKKYSKLHNKAQRKELSPTEKSELNSLAEALLKLDPIKMELFLGLREIKRYIDKDDYYYYEYWNNQRHYKVFSHFFTQLSQRYKSIKEVQKKEIIEEILENWIEETSEEEISLEMKVVLMKILENYNELEELALNFMKLHKKEQLGQISQSEKTKLRSLSKTLGKLSPIKIELFANMRAIKRYLIDQPLVKSLEEKHLNRILHRFFSQLSQKYNKLRKQEEFKAIIEKYKYTGSWKIVSEDYTHYSKITLIRMAQKTLGIEVYKKLVKDYSKQNKSSNQTKEIEELKEKLKDLLNLKKEEILDGTFIPTPDNIAKVDNTFDFGESWKKKAKNLYNVLLWWIQKNTDFKHLTDLKEHYQGAPQVREIAKELNNFLNLKKEEILEGRFIPTLKKIKEVNPKIEKLNTGVRISYIVYRWLKNNTPFNSLQELQEYHNITIENQEVKEILNSLKDEILNGDFIPYRKNFIALDDKFASFNRFDNIINHWIKLETPYKNITELKEKFSGLNVGKKIRKYLDLRREDILSGKFIPTKSNLRKINPEFANYYHSDRSVNQWLNKNSNFKTIRGLITHFLYEISYDDCGYGSDYTLKFNEENYRVKNAWFQVVNKVDSNRLVQIDQRKSPKTWGGFFNFLNKNNQWKYVDLLTGEIMEMEDNTAFHHIDGDKLNDEFFNLVYTLAANHAIITAAQQNWKELSEFFEELLVSNLYSITEGQNPESWKVGWREMAIERDFRLPKTQYIRKKEFKKKFVEIRPYKDLSEWFD